MPRRRRFTDKDRVRIFNAAGGKCHLCDQKIAVGEPWEIEHLIAWELTRDDTDANLRPAHVSCHKDKTHKQDRPAIREAQRREAKHIGAHKSANPLKSGRGFPKSPKPPRQAKEPAPRNRALYAQIPEA